MIGGGLHKAPVKKWGNGAISVRESESCCLNLSFIYRPARESPSQESVASIYINLDHATS